MDFFGTFKQLCDNNGTSPNAVAKILKISSGSVTNWKNGKSANMEAITKIASYFNVSTDYLLGNEQKNKPVTKSDELKPQIANSLKLLNALPQDLQEAAEAYLLSLSDIADKRKK